MNPLKSQADRLFSLYIRKKELDEFGNVQCWTCGVMNPINQMECGHIISRKYLAGRYNELNAMPQCHDCNSKMSQHDLLEWVKRNEPNQYDYLMKLKRTVKHYSESEMKELIVALKLKLEGLG